MTAGHFPPLNGDRPDTLWRYNLWRIFCDKAVVERRVTHSRNPAYSWRYGPVGKALLLAIALFLNSFPAQAAIPVNEDFTGPGFNDPAWQLYGPTALNTGWLRLTPASTDQQGAAILNDPFPSATQMVITFDYAMHGGSGADGFVFFLQDGAETSVGPGDYGGCLGYCRRQATVTPGVRSAYVGIAFDEYGNMSDPGHVFTGGPGVRANHVLIKGQGAADGLSGYQYLTGLDPGFNLATGSRAGAYTIRILIINNVITVQRLVAGTFTTFLTQDLTAAGQTLPATLRLGFTAGTGGSTNIHEIDNLRVDFPTDLVMDKTGSTNVASGGPISYTLTTTNNGPYDVNAAVITDTIPASITGVTWTCAASGGAVCVTGNGAGNALSETINIPMGGTITMTVSGTVSPATLIGAVISNTASVALPNGLADIVAGDNTDTLNTTVNGAAVSIAATTNGAEPGTSGQFTVSLAQPVTQAVTVNYTITGTATSGTDYTAMSGSIVIPANTTSVVLNVPVLDDLVLENPDETVIVTLNSVSSAFTGTLLVAASPNNTATITIFDNEKTASIAATDATGNVSGDTGVVVVTILNNLGAPAVGVTVDLAATGSATLSTYTGVTDANGQISVLVSNTVIESVNVTASYDSDGDNLADMAVVTGSPAVVTFTAGPGGSGPIHAWHLEEANWPTANTAIDYIGTWEGTAVDGATNIGTTPALPAVGGQGTCGYAVFANGSNDNIEIGQQAQNITTSLTLTAWVRTTTTAAGIRYAIARGFDDNFGTGNDNEIYLGMNGANVSAGSRDGGGLTSVSVGAIPLNTWTHIAATATITSGTTAQWRVYVNGVQTGGPSGDAVWPVTSASAYWSIGGRSDNDTDNSFQWNGNVDEVKIYDYALTAAQISAVMGERHACPGPNLSVIKTVTVVDDTVSASNDKAIPGATLRYSITLQNTSPGGYDSDSVVLTDNFDDSKVTYVPGSVSVPATVSDVGGVPAKSNRIVSDPLTVPAGGTVTVTFDVTVD